MVKVLVLAGKHYPDFPRSTECDVAPDVGGELSVGGEIMEVESVKQSPNIDGHDYIVTVRGRYDSLP